MPRIDLIQPRGGTAAEWTSANPILEVREMGEETDTGKSKRGDGVTAWNALPYFGGGITTLEESIAADPVATSVPTFEGGVNSNDDIVLADGVSVYCDDGVSNFGNDGLDDIPYLEQSSGGSLTVTTNNPVISRGLSGSTDYSANIQDLDYVQKIYVDDAVAGGTTPTIQEVLTEGNQITYETEIVFLDTFGDPISSLGYDVSNGYYKSNRVFLFKNNDDSQRVIMNPSSFGILSNIDYSSLTTGIPADDEKIYAQRKYVDDAVAAAGSETATYSATSTAVTTLDCDTFDSRYQILTVNTDIQWSNTPASGESFVKTLEVIGTFSLSFSTSTKIIGTYNDDGSTVNIITVNFANYPTVGLRTTVMINS